MAEVAARPETSLMSVAEIAERQSVGERTVRFWITRGLGGKKLRAIRPGLTGSWRVTEEDLQDFLTTSAGD